MLQLTDAITWGINNALSSVFGLFWVAWTNENTKASLMYSESIILNFASHSKRCHILQELSIPPTSVYGESHSVWFSKINFWRLWKIKGAGNSISTKQTSKTLNCWNNTQLKGIHLVFRHEVVYTTYIMKQEDKLSILIRFLKLICFSTGCRQLKNFESTKIIVT